MVYCPYMKTEKNYKRTYLACYLGFVTQAICSNFAPLLYMMFHSTYGISFLELAMISTVFFLAQLLVDLLCAKAVDAIGYRPSILAAEITSVIGLAGLAFLPDVMPSPLTGILLSAVIYAVGSGLTEVVASPIVEACPSENKEAAMSLLHSFYCWGSVAVILGSTLFFAVFGIERWRILALLWALIPLINIYNFATCPIEKLVADGETLPIKELFRNKLFWVLVLLMTCAGASELSISQWASAFAESALHVSKSVGDLAGPCGFAACMGIVRTLYGRFGEKIDLTACLTVSGLLCVVCYLLAGLSKNPVLGLIGCAACGFTVALMWPGTISTAARVLPKGGTAMFALLALAGDLGCSVGPAIVGSVSQRAGDNLQAGLLAGIGFPLVLAIGVLIVRKKHRR